MQLNIFYSNWKTSNILTRLRIGVFILTHSKTYARILHHLRKIFRSSELQLLYIWFNDFRSQSRSTAAEAGPSWATPEASDLCIQYLTDRQRIVKRRSEFRISGSYIFNSRYPKPLEWPSFDKVSIFLQLC